MINALVGLVALTLFIVTLGFVFYGLVLWPFFLKSKAVREPWAERVAERLGGTYTLTSDKGNPWIRFRLEGRPAQFWAGSEEETPTTRVEVDLRGASPGALRIFRDSVGAFMKRLLRMQDIPIGDAGFDADYVVQSTPVGLALRLFRAERRAGLIASVRRLEALGSPLIELEGERLDVGVNRHLTGEASYLEMVGAAREIVGALLELFPVVPILWVKAQAGEAPQCLVCGTRLESDVVRCKKCRTPHHEDCWRYARRCATYGCGGRRAVRA